MKGNADNIEGQVKKTWERNTSGLRFWKPGESGNPKGRPKKLSIVKAFLDAPDDTEEGCTRIQALLRRAHEIALSGDVKMIIWLLEKHDGKPIQTVVNGDGEGRAMPAIIPVMIGSGDDINAAIEKAQGQIADEVRRLHEQDSEEGDDDDSTGGKAH